MEQKGFFGATVGQKNKVWLSFKLNKKSSSFRSWDVAEKLGGRHEQVTMVRMVVMMMTMLRRSIYLTLPSSLDVYE